MYSRQLLHLFSPLVFSRNEGNPIAFVRDTTRPDIKQNSIIFNLACFNRKWRKDWRHRPKKTVYSQGRNRILHVIVTPNVLNRVIHCSF